MTAGSGIISSGTLCSSFSTGSGTKSNLYMVPRKCRTCILYVRDISAYILK